MGRKSRLKEERKMNKDDGQIGDRAPGVDPNAKELGRMEVVIYNNNQTTVKGIPADIEVAMMILARGQLAVAKHFVHKVEQGDLSAPRIVTPRSILVPGFGRGR